VAQGMIHRPTRDVDLFLFDPATSGIALAAAALEAAFDRRGWLHRRVIDQRDFVRLEIDDGQEGLIVDLGIDSPPEEPLGKTELGPTLSPRDLAARKTLALFGRAEARDFADVYDLAERYGREQLLAWAAADDAGFDQQSSRARSRASTDSATRTCPSGRGTPRICAPTSIAGLQSSQASDGLPQYLGLRTVMSWRSLSATAFRLHYC
jgi:hypothetical protein